MKENFKHPRHKNILWAGLFLVISLAFLFSCGLVENSGSQANLQDSQDGDDDDDGDSEPRLESDDKCFENSKCIEVCDSMLKNFKDQKDCYEEAENKVQSFKDTYSLLTFGSSRKLERIKPKDMETLLDFGPVLWRDAIYGFERGRKENCTVNLNPSDPRDREDCKLKDYYKQGGYDGEGASEALRWIAQNNWLGELLDELDKDEEVATALVNVLAKGLDSKDDTKCPGATSSGDFAHAIPSAVFDFSLDSDEDLYQAFGHDDCVDGDHFFNLAVEGENNFSANVGYELLKELCNRSSIQDNCEKYFFCKITSGADIINYINSGGASLFPGFDLNPTTDCVGDYAP